MPRAYPPDPEESGFLEPPRRRPPTAVGTATPPPPFRRSHIRGFRSRTRLVASAVLASAFGLGAVAAFATVTIWGALAGIVGTAACLGISLHLRRDIRTRSRAARGVHRRAA